MDNKFILKIKRDFAHVILGSGLTQGIGFFTILIISRNLGPENYGVFSLLISIFTIAVQIADFGVTTSYVKYASENEASSGTILYTVLISKIILSVLMTISMILTSSMLSKYFFNTYEYEEIIKSIALAILSNSILNTIIAHHQSQQNFKTYATHCSVDE